MQTITLGEKIKTIQPGTGIKHLKRSPATKTISSPMIYGIHKSFIKWCMWMYVLLLNILYYKNPVKAIKMLNKLRKIRSDFRGNRSVLKYVKANGKYHFTFNAPGFPSQAFNKYILNNIKKTDVSNHEINLDTIVFAITKKCGYQCEHCFEWDALNKPETLDREDLLSIIDSFQKFGITQVQLSGGEPMNRFYDIVYILQNIKKGTEVW